MAVWLTDIREKKGMSQTDVANKIGLSQQAISSYENDERTPSVSTAKAIASVLGFDWTKFYEKEEEEGGESNDKQICNTASDL